jgi:hypothetical protein
MSALNNVRKFFPQVKTVVDSTRNAVIEVTRGDASSRAVKNHSACAMAVACKRKFKLDGVIISRSVAYLIKGNKARRFKLPESVSREVVSFDRGAGFQPGKYHLEKIPESVKLGNRHGRVLNKDRNRNVVEGQSRHVTTNARTVLGGQKPEAPE